MGETKEPNTDCYCECHLGSKVNHWQFIRGQGYQRSKCACEIKDNPNFVSDDIRETWE